MRPSASVVATPPRLADSTKALAWAQGNWKVPCQRSAGSGGGDTSTPKAGVSSKRRTGATNGPANGPLQELPFHSQVCPGTVQPITTVRPRAPSKLVIVAAEQLENAAGSAACVHDA